MRYPKIRELIEALKALIKGPYTNPFPSKNAICSPNYRGKPTFDEETCIGCGTCANVCPTGALIFEDEVNQEAAIRKFTQNLAKCIFCGECEYQCPVKGGIILKPVWDLATTDKNELISKMEKELILCSNCNEVIAPISQLRYLYRKLGPLAFSNPTLILSVEELDKVVEHQKTETIKHQDIFNLLCPRCRHKVLIKDTWF